MENNHLIIKLLRKYKPEFEIKTASKDGVIELILDFGEPEPITFPLDDSVKWVNLKKIVDAIEMINGPRRTKLNSPDDNTYNV